ncbi:hypothetical protein HDU87_006492 [Geranomyces variabilis]|uniref:AB hydrolase-1 domain-containing protein n=1 Tax=Geranomyces variabilis TaxID=109894 RepID=A0AAD5TFS2_9FUNG|nr:hypothetical protein HDU87_006492 [Geranomyces variabilis]
MSSQQHRPPRLPPPARTSRFQGEGGSFLLPPPNAAGPPSSPAAVASSFSSLSIGKRKHADSVAYIMTRDGVRQPMSHHADNWFRSVSPDPEMGAAETSAKRQCTINEPAVGLDRSVECPSGMTVALRIWGDHQSQSGNRKVLCVHGWLDNAASFELLAPRLAAAGACVVAMDIAGHGLSSWKAAGGGYYLWDMVDDILGIADALGWKTFTAAGHSTGGHLLAAFAGCFPDRVSDLIMLDSIGPAVQFTSREEATDMANFIRRRRQLEAGSNASTRRTRVYGSFEDAARARCKGFTTVSIEAARLLCNRGMVPVYPDTAAAAAANGSAAGGAAAASNSGIISGEVAYTWRTDPKLTLWSYLRTSETATETFWRCITARVLVAVGEQSQMFNLTDERHRRRLGYLTGHLTTAVVPQGSHHMHLEVATVDAVAAECLKFLGWA